MYGSAFQTGIGARGRQAASDSAGEFGSSLRRLHMIGRSAAPQAQHAAVRVAYQRAGAGLTAVDAEKIVRHLLDAIEPGNGIPFADTFHSPHARVKQEVFISEVAFLYQEVMDTARF